LSELAATLLYENFTVNGAETIERVRQKKPEVYLASVIALLPKQAQKVESPFVDISDAELEALEEHLAAVRAKLVKQVDATAFPPDGLQDHGSGVARGRVADTAPETAGTGIGQTVDVDNMDGQHVMDLSASAEPFVDDAA